MLNFLKTPAGLLIAAIVVLLLVILISYNRNTIKGWFLQANSGGRYSGSGTSKTQCIQATNGCIYLGLLAPCEECKKRGIPIV